MISHIIQKEYSFSFPDFICCRQHQSWRIRIENTVACLDRICRLKIILCRTIGIYKLKPVWNSRTTTAFTTCQRIIGLLFCYITPCNSVFFHKLINSWVAPCILISISKIEFTKIFEIISICHLAIFQAFVRIGNNPFPDWTPCSHRQNRHQFSAYELAPCCQWHRPNYLWRCPLANESAAAERKS